MEVGHDQRTVISPAHLVAAELGETHFRPIGTIRDLVRTIGLERVRSLVEEAKRVDANGGMMTTTGHRRTLGGCFFSLAKDAVSPEDRRTIFELPQERWREQLQQRLAQQGRALAASEAPAASTQCWTVELSHVPTGQRRASWRPHGRFWAPPPTRARVRLRKPESRLWEAP